MRLELHHLFWSHCTLGHSSPDTPCRWSQCRGLGAAPSFCACAGSSVCAACPLRLCVGAMRPAAQFPRAAPRKPPFCRRTRPCLAALISLTSCFGSERVPCLLSCRALLRSQDKRLASITPSSRLPASLTRCFLSISSRSGSPGTLKSRQRSRP